MLHLGRLLVLLRNEGKVIWAMLRDPHAPKISKMVTLAAVLYVISPVDFVSDLIPVLGWLDDGIIAMLLLKLAMHFLPDDLQDKLRSQVAMRQRKSGSTKAGKGFFNNAN